MWAVACAIVGPQANHHLTEEGTETMRGNDLPELNQLTHAK